MPRATTIEREAKANVVRRLRMQRVAAKDGEQRARKYRAEIAAKTRTGPAGVSRAAKKGVGAGKAALPAGSFQSTILAEGDSWFRYVLGFAVIWQLEKKLRVPILNLATPGDEASEMLSDEQRGRLRRELKRGPALRRKYDFLLFSGGGNDILGNNRLKRWLKDYVSGMTAKQVINNDAYTVALDMLELNFRDLIALRNEHSPSTHLVLHPYDFAVPNGKKVCGLGPWLKPSLEARKVPADLRQEVVNELLRRFKARLEQIVTSVPNAKNISIVDTQGTLNSKQWDNEIHPTKDGFSAIADRFVAHLKAASVKAGGAPGVAASARARRAPGTKARAGASR